MDGVIIVLGSQNDARGRLSTMGLSRVSKALEVFHKQPSYKLLLTGQFGWNFNRTKTPHSEYMKRYFLKHGVPAEDIFPSATSTNTIEDLVLAKQIIDKHNIKDIILVTSSFHMPRAHLIAQKVFGGRYKIHCIKASDNISPLYRAAHLMHETLRIMQLKTSGIPTTAKNHD